MDEMIFNVRNLENGIYKMWSLFAVRLENLECNMSFL